MSVVTDDKAHINWANAYTCQIRKVHTNIQMVCEFFYGMGKGAQWVNIFTLGALSIEYFCDFTLYNNSLLLLAVVVVYYVFNLKYNYFYAEYWKTHVNLYIKFSTTT